MIIIIIERIHSSHQVVPVFDSSFAYHHFIAHWPALTIETVCTYYYANIYMSLYNRVCINSIVLSQLTVLLLVCDCALVYRALMSACSFWVGSPASRPILSQSQTGAWNQCISPRLTHVLVRARICICTSSDLIHIHVQP